MREQWRPVLDGTEDDPWRTVILQAIGTGSLCWITVDGETVFDSETAAWIADGLLAWIEGKERNADGEQ